MTGDERPSDPWLHEHRDLLRPGARALDLGCGTGEDTAELVAAGMRVIAFDRSRFRLRRARRCAPGARFVVGDMTRGLPFPDESFDLVVASLSIHYFDWETTCRIVREIARVLRPGGRFLCRVNRVGDVHFDYGRGTEVEPDFFEVRPGHTKRFFSEESLRTVLETELDVESIAPATTHRWGAEKRTLVARSKKPRGG